MGQRALGSGEVGGRLQTVMGRADDAQSRPGGHGMVGGRRRRHESGCGVGLVGHGCVGVRGMGHRGGLEASPGSVVV